MPSLQRGTHLLDQSAGQPGLESDLLFLFFLSFSFSLFHKSWKMKLHEMNELSTKKCAKCANLQCGSSSALNPPLLNSTFLLFLASISSSLTTKLSILYDHFLHISKIYLLFSSHSTFIQDLYSSLDSYIL